jgi:hypothetical protein
MILVQSLYLLTCCGNKASSSLAESANIFRLRASSILEDWALKQSQYISVEMAGKIIQECIR